MSDVLLMEAGGSDYNPLIHIPLSFSRCKNMRCTIGDLFLSRSLTSAAVQLLPRGAR